jgi:hypothetical protein
MRVIVPEHPKDQDITDNSPLPDSKTVMGHPVGVYGHSVLHAIVAVKDKQSRMLFAYVELLPLEIPAPMSQQPRQQKLKVSGWRVFAAHFPLSLEQGLNWYDDARRNTPVIPNVDGTPAGSQDSNSKICVSQAWMEEPIWPSWVAVSAMNMPFVLPWHKTPRVSHLLPGTDIWDYPPEDAADLDDFFEEEVGFRRSAWPQLFGSMHLVAPNPFYRCMEERLEIDPKTSIEGVRLEVIRRVRSPLVSLDVLITEHRPSGIASVIATRLQGNVETVPIGHKIAHTSLLVRLSEDGSVLEHTEPTPFLRQLQVSMDIQVASRQVVNPHSAISTYEVTVMQPFSANAKGTLTVADPEKMLSAMYTERAVRLAAKQLDQRWVAKDVDGATEYVRGHIGGARKQVLIADPYLGRNEVQRFAFAIELSSVPIRLLTSIDAFSDSAPAELAAYIEKRTAADPTLGKIEIRMLPGNSLHDRFLRVDDRLYSLGNSLNSLGNRGSLMIRVPDPKPVFDELEQIWQQSKPLAKYASSGTPKRGKSE